MEVSTCGVVPDGVWGEVGGSSSSVPVVQSLSRSLPEAAPAASAAPALGRPHLLRAPKERVLKESPHHSEIADGTPLIFLDIDGVLNRAKYSTHVDVKDDLMYNLKLLVDKTGARIVWSTYWRGFRDYLDFVLYRFELDPSVGATLGHTTLPGGPTAAVNLDRAHQIAAFIDDNELGKSPFVILDDREVVLGKGEKGYADQPTGRLLLADRLAPRFVRTVSEEGLTVYKVAEAAAVLGLPP